MKKISQIQWNRYKNSEDGRNALALFQKAKTNAFSIEDLISLAKQYDSQFFVNLGEKDEDYINGCVDHYISLVLRVQKHPYYQTPVTKENYILLFSDIICTIAQDKPEDSVDVELVENIPNTNFKYAVGDMLPLSLALYACMSDVFLPNFFVMQFLYLERIAEKYEIELPAIPNKSAYYDRCMYYVQACWTLHEFAEENNLSTSELCTFLFDYELPAIIEETENEDSCDMPSVPGQAWLLVGSYGEGEKNMRHGFWQANSLTEKGDLLLFYEKSPVKALTSVWIAQENGVVDPFYIYYSNTYIGNRIEIPFDKAVTFDDFKNSVYFKNRDRSGNFVSKNFQDTSGWAVTSEDYKEIRRMLEAKGFDTSVLPSLYEPQRIGDYTIELEKDVSEKLLIPLLEQMGYVNGKDFKAEVEFHAGRGMTGFSSDKRPDFLLHIVEAKDDIEAKVVIEVKKYMKNNKEIHDNFVQGRSYAKWGNAVTLVLCDMFQIRVYQRDSSGSFDEKKYIKFSWKEMENADKYAQLRKMLS